jgi:hypothetical protein
MNLLPRGIRTEMHGVLLAATGNATDLGRYRGSE